jgi:HD-GYP domain-containing protein (c-di-GMP phosphodiesterase class II)
MNGSGYPRQLKGAEIILEARILSVSDVSDSMVSHRPYRPSLGIEAALDELEQNKGILYDATDVDACLRLFREATNHGLINNFFNFSKNEAYRQVSYQGGFLI